MKQTIQQKIESKIGNNYEQLFNDFMKKNQRSRRAFYVLAETEKASYHRTYYTGIKIEKKDNKYIAYQHRMNVSGATYIIV